MLGTTDRIPILFHPAVIVKRFRVLGRRVFESARSDGRTARKPRRGRYLVLSIGSPFRRSRSAARGVLADGPRGVLADISGTCLRAGRCNRRDSERMFRDAPRCTFYQKNLMERMLEQADSESRIFLLHQGFT